MWCITFGQLVLFIIVLIIISWFTPASLTIVISFTMLVAIIVFVAEWVGFIKCD